ncbi:hypothetical protein DPEC_G00018990 [Dallia pectoralis]|uniref:Uncharacterized protein n=1 Tax=Dallia pectoralis TaxID=75939 RepID=A0ACC2HFW5_DALPE|nr:hypothetical protein DPEC_G00018990 [Dallia pectoralis]
MTFPQTKLLASPLLHFTTREISFSPRAFFASLSAASLPSTPTCAGTHANLSWHPFRTTRPSVSSTYSTRSCLLCELQDCKLFKTRNHLPIPNSPSGPVHVPSNLEALS